MKKTVKAFTLVELIVVIAIIGVLAAILVPSMIGYATDAKYSTANANAKLAYTNTATWCSKSETSGHDLSGVISTQIDLTGSGTPVFDGTQEDLRAALCSLMGGNKEAGQAYIYADVAPRWTNWRKGESDKMIGSYPEYSDADDPLEAWGTEHI